MKNLLIGSSALDYWVDAGKDVLVKATTDWDVISNNLIEGTEWHNPWVLNNRDIERFTTSTDVIRYTVGNKEYDFHVVTLQGLAIIKRSHLHRELGFGKHITHFHRYLKPSLNNLYDWQKKILEERTKLTHKAFPQQGPNLNQSVEDFFDDAVTKVFNHDWLHELFAYNGSPMYTKMQRDSSKAWCEKDMWDNFTHEQKLQTVAEETYIIATERFLVPSEFTKPAKLCYNKALDKVCTTLCKGWFRDLRLRTILKFYECLIKIK